jgi:hypothetical protein
MGWGLADLGHNGGPPIDEPVNTLYVRYRWKRAHTEAWKNPSPAIMKFRVSRAEAAGVSYHTYMLALLDTGRHLQKGDVVETDESDKAETS